VGRFRLCKFEELILKRYEPCNVGNIRKMVVCLPTVMKA